MLTRNLHPPNMCNGTKLKIIKLQQYYLEAIIISGCGRGEIVYIPRIPLIPTDSEISFKRLQFPIKLCFSMTINKAQRQTLKTAGICLKKPCFSHGQLYVAMSSVTSPQQLYVFTNLQNKTINVVYQEALQ